MGDNFDAKIDILRQMIGLKSDFEKNVIDRFHIKAFTMPFNQINSSMFVTKKKYRVFLYYGGDSLILRYIHDEIGFSDYKHDDVIIQGKKIKFFCGKEGIFYGKDFPAVINTEDEMQVSLDDLKTPDIMMDAVKDVKNILGGSANRFALVIIDNRVLEKYVLERIVYGGNFERSFLKFPERPLPHVKERNLLKSLKLIAEVDVEKLQKLRDTFCRRNEKMNELIDLATKIGFGDVLLILNENKDRAIADHIYECIALSKSLDAIKEKKEKMQTSVF